MITVERNISPRRNLKDIPRHLTNSQEIDEFVEQCAGTSMSDKTLKDIIKEAYKQKKLLELRGEP